ncbi:MAG: glycosyltransferase family 4 protein [Acidimicrobiia bacterium]
MSKTVGASVVDELSEPSRNLRIAYITTHYPSIPHTFIQREVLALRRRGATVHTFAINPAGDHDVLSDTDRAERATTTYIKSVSKRRIAWVLARSFVTHPVAVLGAFGFAARSGGTDVKAVLWRCFQMVEAAVLHDHCRRAGVHHVHAHFGQAPANIAWFCTEWGNRLEGDARWTWSATIHGWHEFVNEEAASLREKVATASFIACVSDFTRSQLMRISAPQHWPKLHVVRCGVDVDAIDRRTPPAHVGPARILVTARISPEKGHLVLIEAIAILRGRGIDVQARLVGPGPFEELLGERIAELGIADAVVAVGALEPSKVLDELRDADVFCLPTFAEGLPVALMEAMAVGVPVVSTFIAGIPELVIDGETGVVVPAGRADALADAIERLVTDPAFAGALADKARAQVAAHHDLNANIGELAELFGRFA